jgi:hypothetical protein
MAQNYWKEVRSPGCSSKEGGAIMCGSVCVRDVKVGGRSAKPVGPSEF